MKATLITTILAGLFVSASTLALAEAPADAGKGDRAQKAHARLKAADKNGDNLISREEANASLPRLAKSFDAIDTNKDGQLSKDELRAWHQKNGGKKQRQQ